MCADDPVILHFTRRLPSTEEENTKLFNFDGYRTICKVVDVYDGDTITVTFVFRGKVIKHKVRMYGYDSPEMKPRLNKQNRDKEIKKAKEAKEYLKSLIDNKIVIIECGKFGKYGRLLGKIYVGGSCLTPSLYINGHTCMVDMGYGIEYFGGTKKNPLRL